MDILKEEGILRLVDWGPKLPRILRPTDRRKRDRTSTLPSLPTKASHHSTSYRSKHLQVWNESHDGLTDAPCYPQSDPSKMEQGSVTVLTRPTPYRSCPGNEFPFTASIFPGCLPHCFWGSNMIPFLFFFDSVRRLRIS